MTADTASASLTRIVRISPASLGFVLAECEACFVREVRDGIRRPGAPPEIFNLADSAMKMAFAKSELVDLGCGPKFTVLAQGLAVESARIPFPEFGVAIVIAGRLDAFVQTAPDERFVVDYKTSARGVSPDAYNLQLSAYAFCLENPAKGMELPATFVDGLALLVYRPTDFAYRTHGLSGLYGRTEWIELPRRDDVFHERLRRVAELVSGASSAAASHECRYCAYRTSQGRNPS